MAPSSSAAIRTPPGLQRARGRCPIVHMFTSGGLYLPGLGGATLMTHPKFEVIAKLSWRTRVAGPLSLVHILPFLICHFFPPFLKHEHQRAPRKEYSRRGAPVLR